MYTHTHARAFVYVCIRNATHRDWNARIHARTGSRKNIKFYKQFFGGPSCQRFTSTPGRREEHGKESGRGRKRDRKLPCAKNANCPDSSRTWEFFCSNFGWFGAFRITGDRGRIIFFFLASFSFFLPPPLMLGYFTLPPAFFFSLILFCYSSLYQFALFLRCVSRIEDKAKAIPQWRWRYRLRFRYSCCRDG